METEKVEFYREKCRQVIATLCADSRRLATDYAKIDEIFTHYEKYKKIIHKHMPYKDSFTKTEPLMDNHKIAAAFFCSFLKAKPIFYVPDSSNVAPSFREQRANEQGAFLFGLQVVQDFWADKFYDSVSPDDKEIFREPIQLPKTDTDTYLQWFIKLFIYGAAPCFDYENKKFEETLIFFVSHIYAVLEGYSYQYFKAKLHESRAECLNMELAELKKG